MVAISRNRIERFNPHSLTDAEMHALGAGYEVPLAALLTAVNDAISGQFAEPPRAARSCLIVAPRGFGKSFLMRFLELSLRQSGGGAIPVLLPEENYSLRHPHHLLRRIREKLAPGREFSVPRRTSREEADACRTPAGTRLLWQEELAACERALDETATTLNGNDSPDERRGRLLVVTLENLDLHIGRAFRPGSIGEALFRELIADPRGRMFFITSSSRPLEHRKLVGLLGDPIEIELAPWNLDTCLRYFEQLSERLRGHGLDADEVAKARIIHHYIGGIPRLAATVGILLIEAEAVDAVLLLHAMATELTPYYKERFERLSNRAQEVFETLILMGENHSAAEVALYLGHAPNSITTPFRELQDEWLLARTQSRQSSAVRLRITDRMFVHWFRQRESDHRTGEPLLDLLVESLYVAYSREELARIASRAAQAGYIDNSRRIARIAERSGFSEEVGYVFRAHSLITGLRTLADRLPKRLISSAHAQIRNLCAGMDSAVRFQADEWKRGEDDSVRAFAAALLAGADVASGDGTAAVLGLRAAIARSEDPDTRVLLLAELVQVEFERSGNGADMLAVIDELAQVDATLLGSMAAAALANALLYRDIVLGRWSALIREGPRAIREVKRRHAWIYEPSMQRSMAWGLQKSDRPAEAIVALQRAVELARELNLPCSTLLAVEHLAFIHRDIGDYRTAIDCAQEVVELARRLDAESHQFDIYCLLAELHHSLAAGENDAAELAEALSAVDAALAMQDGSAGQNKRISALQIKATILCRLERYGDCQEVIDEMDELSLNADDVVATAAFRLELMEGKKDWHERPAVVASTIARTRGDVAFSVAASFATAAQWALSKFGDDGLYGPLFDWLTAALEGKSPSAVSAEEARGLAAYFGSVASAIHTVANREGNESAHAIAQAAQIGSALDRWPAELRQNPVCAAQYARLAKVARRVANNGLVRAALAHWQDAARQLDRLQFACTPPTTGTARDLAGEEAAEALSYFRDADWLTNSTLAMRGVRLVSGYTFQPSLQLIEVGLMRSDGRPAIARALVWMDKCEAKSALLTGPNEVIYAMNEEIGIELVTPEQVESYGRFFLDMVVGQLGNFIIVEREDEIALDGEISDSRRVAIARACRPIVVTADGEGTWVIDMSVLFAPAYGPAGLFSTRLKVSGDGNSEFVDDEELQVYPVPVLRRRYAEDGLYEVGLQLPDIGRVLPRQTEFDWKAARTLLRASQAKQVGTITAELLGEAGEDRTRLCALVSTEVRRLLASEPAGSTVPGVLMIALAAASGKIETIELLAETAKELFSDALNSPEEVLRIAADFLAEQQNPVALERVQPEIAAVVRTWFGAGVGAASGQSARRRRRTGGSK